MSDIAFLVIYMVILIGLVSLEIYILFNDKSKYFGISYKSLKSICEEICDENGQVCNKKLAVEISQFYNEFIQEKPQLIKLWPNVVVWLDAIAFRIDSGNKKAAILKPYRQSLKTAREILEKENPYNKCEKYQQNILRDIEKMKTEENSPLVQNILNRTEMEFLRLSADIKKNARTNVVSMFIGIIGVVVSIIGFIW